MTKYVLCRPRGGLNDTLCQITKCYIYSKLAQRQLWVDTSRSGFLQCFSEYFEATGDLHFGTPPIRGDCSIYPSVIPQNLTKYKAHYSKEERNYLILGSTEKPKINYFRKSPEMLIMHEQCGGGTFGSAAFNWIKLKPTLRHQIINLHQTLGSYTAIHIRHSDYKSNYKKFLNGVANQHGDDHIVLCTDSFECQRYALNLFENVTLSSNIPDTNGKKLHNNADIDRTVANTQALYDLAVLVKASTFLYCRTESGIVSGFTRLAKQLRHESIEGKLWSKLLGSPSFC